MFNSCTIEVMLPTPSSGRSLDSFFSHIQDSRKVLFITGRAGTGKSTLLKALCEGTRKKYAVVAPTGIAAVNVNGETIHSFFKFKPGITVEEAASLGQRTKYKIYGKLELLIIDEVSMVRADLLDCIDAFLRNARSSMAPFGGVQVVLFGDLYQLEPIVTGDEKDALFRKYESAYFFSSDVFKKLMAYSEDQLIEFVELTKVYRQQDEYFIEILDSIRKKTFTERHLDDLNRCAVDYLDYTAADCIYLTATNQKAAQINAMNLEAIPNPQYTVEGKLEGLFSEKNLPTDLMLPIKEHARIMMLNNDPDDRWINGTLGVLMKINKDNIVVLTDNGKQHVVEQISWSNYKFSYNPATDTITKEVVGTFTQYPIKPAWAITIHKSQGQTFDSVAICLGERAFAHGQTYVALSRCRRLEGIKLERPIQSFDIMVDERVSKFLVSMKKYIIGWKFSVFEKNNLIRSAIEHDKQLSVKYISDRDETVSYTVKPSLLVGGGGEYTLNGMDMDTGENIELFVDRIAEMQERDIPQLTDSVTDAETTSS